MKTAKSGSVENGWDIHHCPQLSIVFQFHSNIGLCALRIEEITSFPSTSSSSQIELQYISEELKSSMLKLIMSKMRDDIQH